VWRLILAYPNLFFITFIGGHIPLHTRRVLAPIEKHLLAPIEKHLLAPIEKHLLAPIEKHLLAPHGDAYRLPHKREDVKFKPTGAYVLSLSVNKPNTAIYVSFQTEKFLEISKLKLDRSNLFHMKRSLSLRCIRAIFRSEQIRYPTKKILVISAAALLLHRLNRSGYIVVEPL
jgi:hypothetical protein